MNVFRACLHPDGLAGATLNFDEWATYLLGQLHRLSTLSADPEVCRLAEEVAQYPNVMALAGRRPVPAPDEPVLLVPWRLSLGGTELSLLTTLTTFGTAQDISPSPSWLSSCSTQPTSTPRPSWAAAEPAGCRCRRTRATPRRPYGARGH